MAKHLATKKDKRLSSVEKVQQQNGRRRAWRNLVRVLACTVVFCTTYALILPAITMESGAEAPHVHERDCYEMVMESGEQELTCQDPQHTHNADCYEVQSVQVDAGILTCTDPEHTHTELCYGQWKLNCPLLWAVEDIAVLIDELPTADAVDKKVAEYKAAGDEEGEETYYTQVAKRIATVYSYYSNLTKWQQEQLRNRDKLEDLEHIWSTAILSLQKAGNGVSKAPTVSTKDFITLNLYDYGSNINSLYDAHSFTYDTGYYDSYGYKIYDVTSTFPGFQWNGGANYYSTYDRTQTDHIDFGNSVITDFVFDNTNSINRPGLKNELGFSLINDADGYDTANYGWVNRPAGLSLYPKGTVLSELADANKVYHTIKHILTPSGFPAVVGRVYGQVLGTTITNYPWENVGDFSQPSLEPLFSHQGNNITTQINNGKGSIDHLFQINPTTGAYFYNSRDNHAQYNAATNSFDVYNQIITPNFLIYPFGNFLPFNDITSNSTSQCVGNLSGGMLKEYFGAKLLGRLPGKINENTSQTPSLKQLKMMLEEYRRSLVEKEATETTAGVGDWFTWSSLDAVMDYFAGNQTGSPNNPGDPEKPEMLAALQNAMSKMYNIDYDVPTNFFFGMDMSMTLTMPKDGLTGNDHGTNYYYESGNKVANTTWNVNANGDYQLSGSPDGIPDYPMIFNFAGDDDVWVYVDGILFLDLSGMHRHVGGRIDFKNGKVHYYALDSAGDGDVDDLNPYQTYTFEDLIRSAYQYKVSTGQMKAEEVESKIKEVINPQTDTFYDYSTHTFKFFYMERGSGSSVCRINFNFPVLQDKSIEVTKEVDVVGPLAGDPDFYFNIINKASDQLFVGPGSVTGVTTYKIKDAAGNFIMEGESPKIFSFDDTEYGKYGIFTLKAGQTAVFENIPENSGGYYVQELIKNDDNVQFDGIFVNNGVNGNTSGGNGLLVNGIVQWSQRPWYKKYHATVETNGTGSEYGPGRYIWHFYSSHYFDASVPQVFLFTNSVDEEKLADVTIGKDLADGSSATSKDRLFKFKITLDGKPLPTTAVEQLKGATLVFEDGNSYILLKHGQRATLENVLSGSVLTLQEVDHAGYTVSYTDPNHTKMWPASYDPETGIYTGTVRAGHNVTLIATNTENVASITLPGHKDLLTGDGKDHTYQFVVQQVVDHTGATLLTEGMTGYYPFSVTGNSVTVTDNADFAIILGYSLIDKAELPKTLYYKVTEAEAADAMPNPTNYVVAVTLSQSGDAIQATLTGFWKNGTAVESGTDQTLAFTNVLAGSLLVEKQVEGGPESKKQTFTFTIKLTLPDHISVSETQPVSIEYRLRNRVVDEEGNVSYVWDENWNTRILTEQTSELKFDSVADGEAIQFRHLPLGTVWVVREIDYGENFLPSGFVTVDGVTGPTTTGPELNGTMTAGKTTAKVVNTATYVMPETGGIGTEPVTLLGAALTLFSTVWLLYKRKRRREEPISS